MTERYRDKLTNTLRVFGLFLLLAGSAFAQQVVWWIPASPQPGDVVTVYYDLNEGTLPDGPVTMHWGVNQWSQPPQAIWPPGTVPAGAFAVQTPMINEGAGVWSLAIQTQATTDQLDFVFTNGDDWDNHFELDWHIHLGDPAPYPLLLTEENETVRDTKTIWGEVNEPNTNVVLHHTWDYGTTQYSLGPQTGRFEYTATLRNGDNVFQLVAHNGGVTGESEGVVVHRRVDVAPEAVMSVNEFAGTIYLDADESWDPQNQALQYLWTQHEDNPSLVSIAGANTAHASLAIPGTPGTYKFNLRLEDPDGHVTRAQTLAEVRSDGSVDPFELWKSARWIRDAVVYEIYPRSYDPSSQLSAITAEMARLQTLGVSCIWLMPVFEGPSDHGYAVTDYYSIEQDIGTLQTFGALVETAHAHGIRVMMDMVINHTDVGHPWMQDAMEKGEISNTWDWYDRDVNGDYTYYYDWESLPNLNYGNPDVTDYLIEMCTWWVTEYDVDGFRCDAAWGVQERNPQFWVDWRRELKTIKPDLFLLAEATVADFTYLTDRFDSAMDWQLYFDPNGFEQLFSNSTPQGLHDRISNYGFDYPEYRYPFRFIENHDEDRYIAHKTPEQTKTAATLLLTIPGVPMLYAGQEVGEETMREQIQWQDDPYNMYEHYETLLWARNNLLAMRGEYEWYLDNSAGNDVFSYARYWPGEPIAVMALNLSGSSPYVAVPLPANDWAIDPGTDYVLTELISGEHWTVSGADLSQIETGLNPYESKLFVIADEPFLPQDISLALVPEGETAFPEQGGVLQYGAVIVNRTGGVVQRNAWTEVELPNGNPFGPLLLTSVNLPPWTITPTGLTQTLPAMAPAGEYQFIANLGLYNPLVIEATDSFGFVKQGAAAAEVSEAELETADWRASQWNFGVDEPGLTSKSGQSSSAEALAEVPGEYELRAPYPNPFNSMATVRIALPDAARVEVVVYNVTGQRVDVLADGHFAAGVHELNVDGSGLASGLYFVRAHVPARLDEVRKLLLVR